MSAVQGEMKSAASLHCSLKCQTGQFGLLLFVFFLAHSSFEQNLLQQKLMQPLFLLYGQ